MNNKKLSPMANKKAFNPSKKGMHTFNKHLALAEDQQSGKVNRRTMRKIKQGERLQAWS